MVKDDQGGWMRNTNGQGRWIRMGKGDGWELRMVKVDGWEARKVMGDGWEIRITRGDRWRYIKILSVQMDHRTKHPEFQSLPACVHTHDLRPRNKARPCFDALPTELFTLLVTFPILKCLRKILKIGWQEKVPGVSPLCWHNKYPYTWWAKTNCVWCGHVVRMEDNRLPGQNRTNKS